MGFKPYTALDTFGGAAVLGLPLCRPTDVENLAALQVVVVNNHAAVNNRSTPTAPGTGDLAAMPATSAILGLMRLDLGVLRHVTVANNSAPFWSLAMEFVQWNFLESVEHIIIANNTAGGIRLKTLQPYFDGQGWVMRNSRITNNSAATEVGSAWMVYAND